MAEEMRVVLRNYGKINPLKITDYLSVGGYEALKKARTMTRKAVIEEIIQSKLRGRGGAGFNTGQKWAFAHKTQDDQKYVICNADEGEPGTYKDRMLMENDPHAIFEGMAICGYAIGANKGYVYCRGEYPHLITILKTAIYQAKQHGILGDFDIEVRTGAGAFVCGEETALLESIEGHRGEPRIRPPFPTQKGLWQKPTVVNNVETLANIPVIIDKGAAHFAAIGAPTYPGTKILTLTGDVNNRTFFEIPTNTTIREVIFEFGGGIPGDKKFKAVQIGGASGAFIAANSLDTQISFDAMSAINSTLGSGAVYVLDETRDIIDVTTRIARFFEHESCGKCAPCREGTARLHELMWKLNSGRGSAKDITLLKKLGRVMSITCLCGLGQAAPTAILTTIERFSDDYEAKLM
ncbi:NADP-reducing hydrogenase subunit HndC [Sporotomaculum syntrophicum]|uniref:NADP-reducing hydrogenase subunit HndC n=1 Tax=Sporotomaculum syntrophicum TaxID=182264 RepID=A0A9D2WMW4_9FIRM|nr:NADH-ubiquinone oxidoreductase-F iron-sulfur binding region domain-containing protein [Sporotomaculum syntrophicum]KAF1084204.1 NADP-reducing hydrogenase subunit HndC [Sporotomaculum syntrophicum]